MCNAICLVIICSCYPIFYCYFLSGKKIISPFRFLFIDDFSWVLRWFFFVFHTTPDNGNIIAILIIILCYSAVDMYFVKPLLVSHHCICSLLQKHLCSTTPPICSHFFSNWLFLCGYSPIKLWIFAWPTITIDENNLV